MYDLILNFHTLLHTIWVQFNRSQEYGNLLMKNVHSSVLPLRNPHGFKVSPLKPDKRIKFHIDSLYRHAIASIKWSLSLSFVIQDGGFVSMPTSKIVFRESHWKKLGIKFCYYLEGKGTFFPFYVFLFSYFNTHWF